MKESSRGEGKGREGSLAGEKGSGEVQVVSSEKPCGRKSAPSDERHFRACSIFVGFLR